ncbi:MAG: RNA-binding domain-containing protein [Sphaerochaeta sp.]
MQVIGLSESLSIEFKSDQKRLTDSEIIEAVVAFANTQGGDLYLGVEDDGTITGLHVAHQNPTQLTALIANRTIPPVPVRCELIDTTPPVLKITVPSRPSIVATSTGKIIQRRIKSDGRPENIPMYPYEIISHLSDLRLLDYSAQPLPGATVDDFSPLERERLRTALRTFGGEHHLLELSDEELDGALQLTTLVQGVRTPTVAGLLILGKAERLKALMPTAESSIQILKGTTIAVNESFTLPLLAAVEKINATIKAYNSSEEFEMGLFRVDVPTIDERAFREALVNAYSHRDYSMLGRVRVQLNDEGLTISNPGGFTDGITLHNLLDAEPHGRNPTLADALKRIGLAERSGRGIDRIYEGSLIYGRMLPDYSESTAHLVRVYIPNTPADKAFMTMVFNEQKERGRSLSVSTLLLLYLIKRLHRPTLNNLLDCSGFSETKVHQILDSLLEKGLIHRVGSGKNQSYVLSSGRYPDGVREASVRYNVRPNKAKQQELVVDLIKSQGYVTRGDVSEHLGMSLPQAYHLLKAMAEKNTITLLHSGRYARYVLADG